MSSRSAVTISVTLLVVSIACGGSSSGPLAPGSPATASSATLQGQTMSATDATAFAGVSVRLGTQHPATSDASGYFTLDNPAGSTTIELTGAPIVDRKTDVRLPSNGVVKFGLIP